jgi:hypothetical protein
MNYKEWKKKELSKMGNNHPDLEAAPVPKEFRNEPEVAELLIPNFDYISSLLPVSLYPDGKLYKV